MTATETWRFNAQGRYFSRCQAGSDGDCIWKHCPQMRDGEPKKSGRHCPLDAEDRTRAIGDEPDPESRS